MVKASLDFGIPAFWAFYVGRHLTRSSENTLYISLAPNAPGWIGQMMRMRQLRTAEEYLRRCAEIIGGTGQSYSGIIADILWAHETMRVKLLLHRSALDVPTFTNLSDPEIRRAINGHLPDDSQLWPQDEIMTVQPVLFSEFDNAFLATAAARSSFKLFVGAYVVWLLSPYTSGYLTQAMLGDLGVAHTMETHIMDHCFESVTMLMPLVLWKLMADSVTSGTLPYDAMRMVKASLTRVISTYGENQKTHIDETMRRLSINAHNQSLTWDLLNKAYANIQVEFHGDYFVMMRRASESSVLFFKGSLKHPSNNIIHIPGVSNLYMYRMLVARELVVRSHFLVPPLTVPGYPRQVVAAVLGTSISLHILTLIDLVFFHNDRLQVSSPTQGKRHILKSFISMLLFFHFQ